MLHYSKFRPWFQVPYFKNGIDKGMFLVEVVMELETILIIHSGCEGSPAATSVTPLIARVDSDDLAG